VLKSSLTDKAHHHIKQWIIHYHLKPGSLLNVGVLAQSLEMSATPVREALSMLEREHMIERRPQKGYVVRGLNLQEIEDLYDLRISLEELAARQAAKRIEKTECKRLAAILEEVGRHLKDPNKPRILELEQDFHVVIFKASGSRPLAEIGCGILDRIWIIQNINLLTTGHLSDAHPQHLQVFQAIANGDSKRAAALMKKHITFAKDFVLSRLKRSDDVLSHWMLGAPLQGLNPKELQKGRRTLPAGRTRKGRRT
jgi:DNA-binding GntR family transcriptional regulator